MGQTPYQLVPVLDQADETLQLGCSIHQEVMLELCEAGGKLALQSQGGAPPDEIGVNFRVRPVIVSDMTCKGNLTELTLLPFSGLPCSI